MIVRKMNEDDYQAYKRLFEEAYSEYLEFLRLTNPQQHLREQQERRKVTRARFDFYLRAESSFVAEEQGEVIGYVASQPVSFMPGFDRVLWIEYIVVRSDHRKRGVGTALLHRLLDHAKHTGVQRITTTINPDNEASIRLHQKAGFNVRDWKVASFKSDV